LTGSSGNLIPQLVGIFICLMGVFVCCWLNNKALMSEKRVQVKKTNVSYLVTFLFGLGFAASCTPCIGPIFGSILLLAASDQTQVVIYTVMYVIGFALPFVTLTFFIGSTKWIVQKSGIIMKVGGVIMIIMGVILFTGQLPRIAGFLLDLVQDTWLSRLG